MFALAGGQAYAQTEDFKRLSALHDEMLASYRARKFGQAKALATMAASLAAEETGGLYRYYQKRLADLEDLDLGPAWTPMIALDEK